MAATSRCSRWPRSPAGTTSSTVPIAANTGSRSSNSLPLPRSSEAVHQAQPSTAATKNGMAVNCASMPSAPASRIGIAEIHTISGGLTSTTST